MFLFLHFSLFHSFTFSIMSYLIHLPLFFSSSPSATVFLDPCCCSFLSLLLLLLFILFPSLCSLLLFPSLWSVPFFRNSAYDHQMQRDRCEGPCSVPCHRRAPSFISALVCVCVCITHPPPSSSHSSPLPLTLSASGSSLDTCTWTAFSSH